MPIKQLNPYLNFNGTAEQAIGFYQEALGFRAEGILRYGDVPGMTVTPEEAQRVIHAQLRLTGSTTLMLCDAPSGQPAVAGTNAHVCLQFDDAEEMSKKFQALAQGGTVTMPLHDSFWGAKFGMLTDRFGIHWMFNCGKEASAQGQQCLRGQEHGRETFINLAVRDLGRSMEFFKHLGFAFNRQFTDDNAACMVISDKAYAMLVAEPFFKTFTTNAICDTRTHTEGLFALSCPNRESVDDLVHRAREAGGRPAMDPKDYGFMYTWSFYDLDGHHWEVLWMDPSHVKPFEPA